MPPDLGTGRDAVTFIDGNLNRAGTSSALDQKDPAS
jgi:hypothetical protein